MECVYNYNGKEIQDIIALSREFFSQTKVLSNEAAIYSSDEIKKSAVKKLTDLVKLKTAIEDNTDLEQVLDFITNANNAPILKRIGVATDRLAPEYILEERAKQYILNELKNRVTNFDASNIVIKDKLLFNKIREMSEFNEINDDELKFYLSKLEVRLDYEHKTRDFARYLHELVSIAIVESDGINSGKYNSYLSDVIKNNPDIFGVDLDKEWTVKIKDITYRIAETVLKIGTPITELTLKSGDNDLAQIKGRLDLISVDNNGIPHIFDIKISQQPYNEWESVKLRTLDWQLALYRQLVSKHLPVRDSGLYVLPVQLGELGNPNSLHYTGSINRGVESYNGLGENGKITVTARLLVPDEVIIKYDETRVEKFNQKLEGVLPSYMIKTSDVNYDVDKIVEAAKKEAYAKDGIYSYYNRFANNDFGSKYITATSEEEFREKIIAYVELAKQQQHIEVVDLKKAINTVLNDPSLNTISLRNKRMEIKANRVFKDYLDSAWEILDIEEATRLGLILFRNTKNNTIDVVSLSVFTQYQDYSGIPGLLYKDVEAIKALLFFNEFKSELFLGNGTRLGKIIAYNTISGDGVAVGIHEALENFIKRMSSVGRNSEIRLDKNNLVSEENYAITAVLDAANSYEGKAKSQITQIFQNLTTGGLTEITEEQLLLAQAAMVSKFPELKDKTFDAKLNFDDHIEYIFVLVQVALLKKQHGITLYGDFVGMSELAFRYSDFKTLIDEVFKRKQPEYDNKGNKILGPLGGLKMTTPDFVRSNDLKNINLIIANVNLKIGQKMVEQSDRIHKLTMEYYDQIGYTKLKRNYIGDSQSRFENLFLKQGNKVSKEFRTKNPFENTVENNLTGAEAKYLKNILFEIQKYMLDLTSTEIKAIDPEIEESLRTNEKIAKALDSGDYFKIPLVRREELSKHKGLIEKGLHAFWERFKNRKEELDDFLDGRELDPEVKKDLRMSAVGYTEMYDVYKLQNDAYKDRMITKHGVDYFEFNLDTIAHRVAFNKIRKYQYDSKLPVITAYIWWIKLYGGRKDEKLDKIMKYIKNQLSLAAYDEPIIDEELTDVLTGVSLVKKFTTAMMLGLRPALFIKELTLGVMKGVGIAASKIYGKDQFTLKDLTTSYMKLTTINDKFAEEFNLIDKINHFYRFANMDVNTIAKKLQTDRRGVYRGLGRWMYIMNTAPDYINRLSLFLAKMIHDGSYEAHSMEDGKLVYDPTKDKRFEYYFKNREKYKNNEGEYVPAPNDVIYNTQRNHYRLIMEQLNQEKSFDEVKYTENDKIKEAYSGVERSSFKSFTDMSYGYYDKDFQSQLNSTAVGIIWLQFLQFWPGKMRQWFGKRVEASESQIGSFKQKSRIENGKEVLLWYDREDPSKEVNENTGNPVMVWEGSVQEGLMFSVLGVIRDTTIGLRKGDFSDVLNDKDRLRRVQFAFHDAVLMFLLMSLVKFMIDALIEENGTDGLSGELLQFSSAVSTKVLRETNVFNNTFGAVNLEPVSLSYMLRLGRDMGSVMYGNKGIQQLLGSNVGATEFLKE